MMPQALCSGPLCIEVEGVAPEVLAAFFAPLFTVRVRRAGDNPLARVQVESVAVETWQEIRMKFLQRPTRRCVLYPSKKSAHHIEGLMVEEQDEGPLEILCPTCLITVDREQRTISLLTDETADCQPTLRVVVRDVMKRAWEQRGAVMMHGAAVVQDGCGTLITGPKGTGKSNLMLQFVRQGAQVLAFDRVMLARERDELILYAWPTYFNLDLATLERHRDCFSEEPEVPNDRVQHHDGKVSLLAEQVKGFGLLHRVRWERTIFPVYQQGRSDWQSRLLSEAEAGAVLMDECLSAEAPLGEDWHGLITLDPLHVRRQAQTLIAEMAASRNCWQWVFGESAAPAAKSTE